MKAGKYVTIFVKVDVSASIFVKDVEELLSGNETERCAIFLTLMMHYKIKLERK